VIKPLNGVDNLKLQPIIRKLSNVNVAITPFALTPLHQVTKPIISQMISFNEYQENANNNQSASNIQVLHNQSQGAVGQNILNSLTAHANNSHHNISQQAFNTNPVKGVNQSMNQ
jgi:hypothetical protein